MKGSLWIIFFAFGLVLSCVESWSYASKREAQCEILTVSMCSGFRYNSTAMPNFMGHTDQIQAENGLKQFAPLVRYNCSQHMQFFLCAVFAPVCLNGIQIPACKPLCLAVRNDCEPALAEHNLPWPNLWDCDRFSDQNELCVQPPPTSSDDILPEILPPSSPELPILLGNKMVTRKPISRHRQCPPNFVKISLCAPRCGADAYYRGDDKKFAVRWMTGWAWLCFLSTLFTLLTFLVEPSRFRYPERPIVFLALSYNLLSCLYIVRGFVGPEVFSCASQYDGSSYVPIENGLQSMPCTFWWIFKYYLSLSSSIWWSILCGCWLLSARNEWSTEALHNISGWFHSIAWGLPLLFIGGSLLTKNIVADELIGLCQISDELSLWWDILPHCLLLLLGCIFGCIAGVSLIRIRQAIRSSGKSSTKLERLMTRLGIFGVLYALPAIVELLCALHESSVRPKWREFALMTAEDCRLNNKCIPGPVYLSSGLEVLLLRTFLSLFVGITSGMWVWSGKTCRAWSKLIAAPSKSTRRSVNGPLIQTNKTFQAVKIDGISAS
ncbi:hypothetical protein HCN44_011118 [Aphidius gifuensis]|uniref:Frizzled-4 n=1 Tax=Aphidius gifuensis TaxID=684658 RepID=A0A834XZ57_APHGI|nr:hypothetical protein HCN44_011118 [Aphidius gifuensis]